MAYKRCGVVFNLENPSHSELYDWCCKQTTNFSDFVRTLLFAYMQSQQALGTATLADFEVDFRIQPDTPFNPLNPANVSAVNQLPNAPVLSSKSRPKSDRDAMADMF